MLVLVLDVVGLFVWKVHLIWRRRYEGVWGEGEMLGVWVRGALKKSVRSRGKT